MSENRNWKSVPVYPETGAYARAHGELAAYRASVKANDACKQAIEQAIRENFDGMRLNTRAVQTVLDAFGPERMMYVLANTVQQKDYDGRFGKDNIAWAWTIPVQADIGMGMDRRAYLIVESHPAVLDGFVRHARAVVGKLKAEPMKTQMEKAKAASSPISSITEKPNPKKSTRSALEH
ncbi:MAG: DUF3849 domain-containing protein [Clostridia bacterium]|nr:DUF3849 domain-containing protein [Clostridia bacterium]